MYQNLEKYIQQIVFPQSNSHKGQNGKLLIIGGSELFHSALIWSLTVASRIVDLVHYCSTVENNEIVKSIKSEFRNGIVITRSEINEYIDEDDAILIGPGMIRSNIGQFDIPVDYELDDNSDDTYKIVNFLLNKFNNKKWIIDAGALQMLDIKSLPRGSVLTPHHKEFDGLLIKLKNTYPSEFSKKMNFVEEIKLSAKLLKSILIVKGEIDYICDGRNEEVKLIEIEGGNSGMTKGGTGDVLSGLVAALCCKHDMFVAAICGSYINKKAGESLFSKVGYFYNASDLASEIPIVMKKVFKI